MYEMLVGYPPFYSDEPMSTCRKVKYALLLISADDYNKTLVEVYRTFLMDLLVSSVNSISR